jgi:transposase
MKHYIGCDVSMKAISVCAMEENGRVAMRKDVSASPETLLSALKPYLPDALVGLEAGSTSDWLVRSLREAGVETVCLETYHARKVLSAQPVKTDRNDAEGLAQILRTGWYKQVHVKSEGTQETKCWPEARETAKHKQQDAKNAIRGLAKPFGIILPSGSGRQWTQAVRERLKKERPGVSDALRPLIAVYEALCDAMAEYDKHIETYAKRDEVCKRLQTIDGIGPINAYTFKAIIENPDRFGSNRDVGAYLGLTPRIYASGETERRGHISRAGSTAMRSLLFEAAQVLLARLATRQELPIN